jgi:multicomponent Na+:H+ antiporter subunit E
VRVLKYIVTFLIFFLLWVIWSGVFDAWHLSLGVISCILVTYISHDLLFEREKFQKKDITETIRFIKYIPWLIYQIVLANVHVAKVALHPKMNDLIDPHIIRFKTKLKKDMSLVTFANSITLTPGTITILIRDGYYFVHALDKKVAADLPGEMEERVAHIFMEDQDG